MTFLSWSFFVTSLVLKWRNSDGYDWSFKFLMTMRRPSFWQYIKRGGSIVCVILSRFIWFLPSLSAPQFMELSFIYHIIYGCRCRSCLHNSSSRHYSPPCSWTLLLHFQPAQRIVVCQCMKNHTFRFCLESGSRSLCSAQARLVKAPAISWILFEVANLSRL